MRFIRNLLDRVVTREAVDEGRARLSYASDDFAAIYAVGDIHGCYKELMAAEKRIIEDCADETGPVLVVYLGDYIDRGPASSDVLDHLCSAPPAGFQRITLCGNHEDSFLRFYEAPQSNMVWLDYGGYETLYSYGIDAAHILKRGGNIKMLTDALRAAVPERHLKLLRSLPVLLTIGKLVFVHAGIRPGMALDDQEERDFLWIREPFLSEGPGMPMLVVHGHTAENEPVFSKGRVGIDTGAFATGKLTVLKISGNQVRVL